MNNLAAITPIDIKIKININNISPTMPLHKQSPSFFTVQSLPMICFLRFAKLNFLKNAQKYLLACSNCLFMPLACLCFFSLDIRNFLQAHIGEMCCKFIHSLHRAVLDGRREAKLRKKGSRCTALICSCFKSFYEPLTNC